jgi:hypothetical protein
VTPKAKIGRPKQTPKHTPKHTPKKTPKYHPGEDDESGGELDSSGKSANKRLSRKAEKKNSGEQEDARMRRKVKIAKDDQKESKLVRVEKLLAELAELMEDIDTTTMQTIADMFSTSHHLVGKLLPLMCVLVLLIF